MENAKENKKAEKTNEQPTQTATPEKEVTTQVEKTEAKTPNPEKASTKNNGKKSKVIKGAIIGVISAFLVFAIAVASIIGIVVSATSVSLDDYVTDECQFVGADGYGSVYAENIIDYEALDAKILKENDNNDMYDWFYVERVSSEDYIDITYPENNGSLSNGDEIEIIVTIDKTGIKNDSSFKKTISGKESRVFTFTVSGLIKAEEIDVFDAVDSVDYDAVSGNISINFKEDYARDYGNGISVKYMNSSLEVYINDEWYHTAYINYNSDGFNTDYPKVTLYTEEDQSKFIEGNFVLSETEKVFDANVISYLPSMNINDNDIRTLKKYSDDYMDANFGAGKSKYQKAVAYYNTGDSGNYVGLLIFYYEVDGKIYGAIYESLKQDQNGNIYNIDQLQIKTFRSWLWNEIIGEEKIEDFETKHMTYVDKEDVTIPN